MMTERIETNNIYGKMVSMAQPIIIKYFDGDIEKVRKIEQGDWVDLRSRINLEGKAGEYHEIPLGVAMILPEGCEAIVAPRSSSFKKFGFIQTNGIGVIDESYSGDFDEWKLPVYFVHDGTIKKGDRICQFRIQKKMPEVEFKTVHSFNRISRGGLGTTGTN